jgi:hypothetical protein
MCVPLRLSVYKNLHKRFSIARVLDLNKCRLTQNLQLKVKIEINTLLWHIMKEPIKHD